MAASAFVLHGRLGRASGVLRGGAVLDQVAGEGGVGAKRVAVAQGAVTGGDDRGGDPDFDEVHGGP